MKLEEFANAQNQLDLWKLVRDAVWAGINTRRRQKAQQAHVAAHSKAQPKPRAKRLTLQQRWVNKQALGVAVPPGYMPNATTGLKSRLLPLNYYGINRRELTDDRLCTKSHKEC